MHFDFGEIFTHAWQITWKNKVLWALTILPFLVSLLIIPFWLTFVFINEPNPDAMLRFMQNPVWVTVASILYVGIFVVSIFSQVISRASVTLGVYRVEMNESSMKFTDLLKDGLAYFWRVLGVSFLMFAAMATFMFGLFACTALVSVATMGLGAICVQPLFLLMIPLMLLALAFLEQSEAAVIADRMSVMDAARQSIQLIKSNVWKYLLVTFAIYFVMNMLVSMLMLPFMVPTFLFAMNDFQGNMDFGNMMKFQTVFFVILFPLMALLQGFVLTYMKSAMVVMYLRLTRSNREAQPVAAAAV